MWTPRLPARRLPLLAVAVVCSATLIPISTASTASAASWTTLSGVDGAAPQACKVPVGDGRAFKVRTRLVNRSSQTAQATFTVRRGGSLVDRARFSTEPGQTTAVKVVRVPDARTHRLGYGFSTPDGGLGDIDALGLLRRC